MTSKSFNEKALNQLFKHNLPYRQAVDESYIIDIPVKETINGDLYFTCPFCVNKRKKNNNPYQNSKPVIHFHGKKLGLQTPHCDEPSKKYWNLPRYTFNLIEHGSAPYVASKF